MAQISWFRMIKVADNRWKLQSIARCPFQKSFFVWQSEVTLVARPISFDGAQFVVPPMLAPCAWLRPNRACSCAILAPYEQVPDDRTHHNGMCAWERTHKSYSIFLIRLDNMCCCFSAVLVGTIVGARKMLLVKRRQDTETWVSSWNVSAVDELMCSQSIFWRF